MDIQSLLNNAAEGATVKIPAGTYRLSTALIPKKNQQIIATGVTFQGSVVVDTWTKTTFVSATGATKDCYYASGLLPATYSDGGVCDINSGEESNSCQKLEDVFYNGTLLTRTMVLKNLDGGKVFSDYQTNRIYIVDVPKNIEVARTRHFMNTAVTGVRVSGATIKHFASPSQLGALTIRGAGWLVGECIFIQNHASGLHCTMADRLVVNNNLFQWNGQAGMTHHKTNDSKITNNRFAANNTAGYYKRDWESAGLKVTYSQRTLIQNNLSAYNNGIGIWLDIDNKNYTIDNNIVKNNFSCGIRVEISFDGRITNNTITGNGFGHAGAGRGSDYSAFATAAIHINGAGGTGNGILDISNNKIGLEIINGTVVTNGRGNQNAIHIEERYRGKSVTYPTLTWTARNIKVHDNLINITRALDKNGKPWYGTGVVGLGVLNGSSKSIYETSTGNKFTSNKYYTNNKSETQFHVYDTAINQYRDFASWQRKGWDVGGTITVV